MTWTLNGSSLLTTSAVSLRDSPPTNWAKIVFLMIVLMGSRALMKKGVIFVPSFTSQLKAMEEKRNEAFFSSALLLYLKAISVSSNENFAINEIRKSKTNH